ncbi:MAG: VanW family protein [Anaerolineae bacterium]
MSEEARTVGALQFPLLVGRLLSTLALFLGLFILTLVGIFILYQTLFTDRVYLGVKAMGLDIGGLSVSQVEDLLRQDASHLHEKRLTLHYGRLAWRASPLDLGVTPNVEATAAAAYRVGRQGDLWDNMREQAGALWYGRSVSPMVEVDQGVATVFLSRLARQIDLPARDAQLVIEGLEVSAVPGQVGRRLNVEASHQALQQHLLNDSWETVDLVVEEITPAIPDASDTVATLQQMLGSPLRLIFTDQTWLQDAEGNLLHQGLERSWTLDRAALADMVVIPQRIGEGGQVELVPGLDQGKLKAYVMEIARQISQPAREARFDFDEETGQLTPLVLSQEGRQLDVEATIDLINAQITGSERVISLPVILTRPKVTTDDMAIMNITELASSGTTYFRGSSWGRMQNIRTAASQFHGIVVPPGEEFSFNQYLGHVVDASGYEESYIIYGDRTQVGIGGGVCQVSTTAFRAAFWGGYPITERWAHGYTVSWYEPPVGLDATVYAPEVDFKFRNDTPHYILIETETDLRAGTVTFNFYGTKPDREVEIEGPFIENVVPHGPPILEDDPSLPKGTRKQVDWAKDGKNVTVYRIIKRGDEEIARQRFFSRYRPWRARYLVGTREES